MWNKLFLIVFGLSMSFLAIAENSGVVSAEKIKEALTPVIKTRGLGATRQIDIRPSISLKVDFESRSAKVTSTGETQLDELARALQSPELLEKRYAVDGHSDAKGSAKVNQRLSESRAIAVKKYLVDRYGIGALRLVTKGYGSTSLLKPSEPYAAENRRVEIVELP